MLPERFELEYIDADGQPKRPVAIHRAIFGSFERFIGILTEHFAGRVPDLAGAGAGPRAAGISEKHVDYARTVHERLRAARMRAELDDRNEKLGYTHPRRAAAQGPLHARGRRAARPSSGTVSLRHRTGEDSAPCRSTASSPISPREIAARVARPHRGPLVSGGRRTSPSDRPATPGRTRSHAL